eukprot:SAG11_NODE_2102_length_3820_cov_2.233808_6_plen_202_part_00
MVACCADVPLGRTRVALLDLPGWCSTVVLYRASRRRTFTAKPRAISRSAVLTQMLATIPHWFSHCSQATCLSSWVWLDGPALNGARTPSLAHPLYCCARHLRAWFRTITSSRVLVRPHRRGPGGPKYLPPAHHPTASRRLGTEVSCRASTPRISTVHAAARARHWIRPGETDAPGGIPSGGIPSDGISRQDQDYLQPISGP